MPIFQLCYISRAIAPWTSNQLMNLLEKSREANHGHNITGLLLHDNGTFIQLLEGPEAAVRKLYAHIQIDPRHGDLETLFQAIVDHRTFPEWELGFCDPRDISLKTLPGHATFFNEGFSLQDFAKGAKARLFFFQFRNPAWRSKLEQHPLNAFSTACA
jgi:hypothetical protein